MALQSETVAGQWNSGQAVFIPVHERYRGRTDSNRIGEHDK